MGAGVSELGEFSSTAFGIFLDRVGIAEGISTGCLVTLSDVSSSSVHIMIS